MSDRKFLVTVDVSRTALAASDPADYRVDEVHVPHSTGCATFVRSVLAKYQDSAVIVGSGTWFGYLTDRIAKQRLVAVFAVSPNVRGVDFATVAIDPPTVGSSLFFSRITMPSEGLYPHQISELEPFVTKRAPIAMHLVETSRAALGRLADQQPDNLRLKNKLAANTAALGDGTAAGRLRTEASEAAAALTADIEQLPISRWRTRLPPGLIDELDSHPGAWLKNGVSTKWGLRVELTDDEWNEL